VKRVIFKKDEFLTKEIDFYLISLRPKHKKEDGKLVTISLLFYQFTYKLFFKETRRLLNYNFGRMTKSIFFSLKYDHSNKFKALQRGEEKKFLKIRSLRITTQKC